MSKVATKQELQQEYQQLCMELGQLTLQHADATERLGALNGRMTAIRDRSKQIAKEFAEIGEAEDGGSAVSTAAS